MLHSEREIGLGAGADLTALCPSAASRGKLGRHGILQSRRQRAGHDAASVQEQDVSESVQRAQIKLFANRQTSQVLSSQVDGDGRDLVRLLTQPDQRRAAGTRGQGGQLLLLLKITATYSDRRDNPSFGIAHHENVVVEVVEHLAQLVLDRTLHLRSRSGAGLLTQEAYGGFQAGVIAQPNDQVRGPAIVLSLRAVELLLGAPEVLFQPAPDPGSDGRVQGKKAGQQDGAHAQEGKKESAG
ncbi:MAG TPA: hypothetical protein VI455_19020 [Terriglobia bacterium]